MGKQKHKKESINPRAEKFIENDYLKKPQTTLHLISRANVGLKVVFAAFDDDGVSLYEFDNNKSGSLLDRKEWKDFSNVVIDHFFLKSVFIFTGDKEWVLSIDEKQGKQAENIVRYKTNLSVRIKERPGWRKVVGYRSNTIWKMAIASVLYTWLILAVLKGILPESLHNTVTVIGVIGLLLSTLALIVGMFKPSLVLPKAKVRTKKRAAYSYTYLIFAFFLMIGVFTSVKADSAKVSKNNAITKTTTVKETSAQKQEEAPKKVTYELDGATFEKPSNVKTATVTSVLDGDTIKVNLNGKEETVRMALIDTPEATDQKNRQPWGSEASQFATDTLIGKTIELESGTPDHDQDNRFLAYVWVGNTLFNALAIDKGYARVTASQPNQKYEALLRKVETTVKTQKLGIWSKDGYVTDTGFNIAAVQPAASTASTSTPATPTTTTKQTEQTSTPAPTTTVSYKNCTQARAAGVTPIYKGQPGYAAHLDRDGDGIACEDSDFDSGSTQKSTAPTTPSTPVTEPKQTSVYYKNCAAVRAAGAAPLYRGQPGYDSHLDRDGDGVACER